MNPGQEYLQTMIRRLKYYKDLGEKTFEQLEEKDFHFQPSSDSNSIAVIIRHMAGNMLSRFTNFLTEDGEKSWRQRDDEFVIYKHAKSELIDIWNKGWNCLLTTLEALTEDDVLKQVTIRNEQLSVMDAINRQLAHYAYHIGQIITIARIIRNKNWTSLSIPRGESSAYNSGNQAKDPAKKF